eukprot:scaffold16724_cov127-Isochrysis_galbana.AAC.3
MPYYRVAWRMGGAPGQCDCESTVTGSSTGLLHSAYRVHVECAVRGKADSRAHCGTDMTQIGSERGQIRAGSGGSTGSGLRTVGVDNGRQSSSSDEARRRRKRMEIEDRRRPIGSTSAPRPSEQPRSFFALELQAVEQVSKVSTSRLALNRWDKVLLKQLKRRASTTQVYACACACRVCDCGQNE